MAAVYRGRRAASVSSSQPIAVLTRAGMSSSRAGTEERNSLSVIARACCPCVPAGFPLTQVPDEYRALLLRGIGITFGINLLCAIYSRGIAAKKEEPVNFWFVKVALFGGLALGELSEAVPMPTKPKNGRGAGL